MYYDSGLSIHVQCSRKCCRQNDRWKGKVLRWRRNDLVARR